MPCQNLQDTLCYTLLVGTLINSHYCDGESLDVGNDHTLIQGLLSTKQV